MNSDNDSSDADDEIVTVSVQAGDIIESVNSEESLPKPVNSVCMETYSDLVLPSEEPDWRESELEIQK